MAEAIIRPPGPKGRHFVRSPLLSGDGPPVNLPRMARRYGDTSFWQFLHIFTYFFAHPDQIESVLVPQNRSFTALPQASARARMPSSSAKAC